MCAASRIGRIVERLLQRSQFARLAAYFDLALLFIFGAVEVVWPFSVVALVIGVALVLTTPILAVYVRRVSRCRHVSISRPRSSRQTVFASRRVRLAGYVLFVLAFILGGVLASGYWVENGALGIGALIVVLAAPLAAAYIHDSGARA